jgi:3-oxoacyl-[acyl-carrier-protein] synthase III
LYYCNTQLEQITKIETYEYQKAVNDLREEIELMLEKNKLTEEELANLKKNQENKRLRSQ